jgi:hypothetical protein
VSQKDQSVTEEQEVFCPWGLLQDTRGHLEDDRTGTFPVLLFQEQGERT